MLPQNRTMAYLLPSIIAFRRIPRYCVCVCRYVCGRYFVVFVLLQTCNAAASKARNVFSRLVKQSQVHAT